MVTYFCLTMLRSAFLEVPSRSSSSLKLRKCIGRSQLFSSSSQHCLVDTRPFFKIFYNDVYEVNLPPGHRFPMEKYRKVREAVQYSLSEDEKKIVNCDFHISPLATKDQLLTTHDEHYVDRYLRGDMTESENRNIGFPWRYARAFSIIYIFFTYNIYCYYVYFYLTIFISYLHMWCMCGTNL